MFFCLKGRHFYTMVLPSPSLTLVHLYHEVQTDVFKCASRLLGTMFTKGKNLCYGTLYCP
jgi:hypothetical protein